MDLRHLREQARGRRLEADTRRKQATRLIENAATHMGDGNPQTAQAEQAQVAKLNEEAAQLEAQAVALDTEANDKEREIKSIEDTQQQLRAEFDQRMNELDKQKNNLLGSSMSLF